MSDLEDRVDASDSGGDDLFGDDGDDVSQIAENDPILSDDDLASEHDRQHSEAQDVVDEDDERGEREGSPVERRTRTVMEVPTYRHGLPKVKDGNMQMAKVPNFLRFTPEEYKSDEFQPSEWAIENSKRRNPINLVRYRRNPETGELESNANIYRWSDGSLTIQVGEEHYEMQVKAQVPPLTKPYVADRDAHRYVAAAHQHHEQLLTVGHVNEEWTIRPDKQRIDEDTEALREMMRAAKGGLKEGEMIITTNQDPELQKKQAEMAEKERTRAQRRRENAQARIDGVGGGYRRGGLSIGELEGAKRATSGKKRGPGSRKTGGRRHRNDEYDTDDDLPAGQSGRNNEYDKEDDFIASSDEEMMGQSGNDDDDILDDVDESEDERPRAKRQRTAEPSHDADDAADAEVDADADGEPEYPAPAHSGGDHRRRVRRVVSDDDDE